MDDIITVLHRHQLELADPVAKQLFKELKPYVATKKFTVFSDYLSNWEGIKSGVELDLSAVEICLRADLQREALVGIKGYTDWAASRIVRTNDYTVPAPSEIQYEAIQESYDVKFKSLERIISYMHAQRELPLLGIIYNGKFNPD